jgi:hypothetical protein
VTDTSAPISSTASSGPADAATPLAPGWDRIGAAALTRTAQAVAAEALRAPFRDVRAHVSDDGRGALAIEVRGPLAVPELGSGRHLDEPVIVSAHRARAAIAERVSGITGRNVERVTVVFTSSVVEQRKRVR